MKSILLPMHLVFVGLWLGCVLTEALFERALLGNGPDQELLLAGLHRRVDLFVEIPVIILVLVTGGLLLAGSAGSPLLYVKVGFGFLAVLANAVCVKLVFVRAKYASAGNWVAFKQADDLQHKVGAVVLFGIMVALGLGLYRAAA